MLSVWQLYDLGLSIVHVSMPSVSDEENDAATRLLRDVQGNAGGSCLIGLEPPNKLAPWCVIARADARRIEAWLHIWKTIDNVDEIWRVA